MKIKVFNRTMSDIKIGDIVVTAGGRTTEFEATEAEVDKLMNTWGVTVSRVTVFDEPKKPEKTTKKLRSVENE